MADTNDPFQRVPREFETPVPEGAAPPPGPTRRSTPSSAGTPGPVASPYAPGPVASPSAAPDEWAAAAPEWSRRWGTTMARWGVGWAVVLVGGFVIGPPLVRGNALVGLSSDEVYQVAGFVMGVAIVHMALFGWWLDHIVAGVGRWFSLGAHVVGVLLWTGMAQSGQPEPFEASAVPTWLLVGVPIVLVVLWQLAVMGWKDAFRPVLATPPGR